MDRALSATFGRFFNSEKAGGLLLVTCTIASLLLSNSALGGSYLRFWHLSFAGMDLEHWVNDLLMAAFFLLIGLELERELYSGELAHFRNALLPIVAAAGGLIVPALIHLALNAGTPTQPGFGIPMATDIAFALGALALLGSRVPSPLRVFLTALAVIDDLGAIILIAVFYTARVSFVWLLGALLVFGLLVICNRVFRLMALTPYLLGGALLWFFLFESGVHATLAGVMLAFAIPYSARAEDKASPSHRLERLLQRPVAFIVLPLFALANTGIIIGPQWTQSLTAANSSGILAGLLVGKPLGITLASFIAVSIGLCTLPANLNWKHIFGAGLLGGIGFTMSIFITNLAFSGSPETVTASKLAILLASLVAGIFGLLWLRIVSPKPSEGKTAN